MLTSWKEIAAYLGKGVRTVQRWEREFGLPIRRPAGARISKGPILALASDLDAWVSLHCLRTRPSSQLKDSPHAYESLEACIRRALALRMSNRMLLMELKVGIQALQRRLDQLAALRNCAAADMPTGHDHRSATR